MPLSKLEGIHGTKVAEVYPPIIDKINELVEAVNKLAAYNRIIVGEDVRTNPQGANPVNHIWSGGTISRRTDLPQPIDDGDQQLPKDTGKAGSD
jgi:hypothetical protein